MQVKASYKLADELKAKEQKRLNVRQQPLENWCTCCPLSDGSGRLSQACHNEALSQVMGSAVSVYDMAGGAQGGQEGGRAGQGEGCAHRYHHLTRPCAELRVPYGHCQL